MQRKPPTNKFDDIDGFINGAKDEKTTESKQQSVLHEETDLNKFRRQTFYIPELYIKAIEQMAFYESMDKSEIVRMALMEYIPKKYLNFIIKE